MTELFGTPTCPYTQAMREHLQWSGEAFVEHDVERDASARARLLALTPGRRTVPVLARDGRVVEIGWRGRGCALARDRGEEAE